MARPPGTSSTNSPARTAPAHGSSRSVKFRQYVVPIPPTPVAVAKAIRNDSQRRPPQLQRIRSLSVKLQDQLSKVEQSRARMKQVEEDKQRALRKLRVEHQTNTAQAVSALEQRVWSRHEQETASALADFETRLQAECEKKRKEWEAKSTPVDTEPLLQRIRLLGEAAKGGELEKEGAIALICQPALDSVEIKSDGLKTVLKEKEKALEELRKSKFDLVWLFKRVIQADVKQKAQMAKKEGSK